MGEQAVQPRQYKVKIDSAPPGADVFVDGMVTGVTPWSGTLPKGEHTVDFKLLGYMVTSKPFDVKATKREQELFGVLIKKPA